MLIGTKSTSDPCVFRGIYLRQFYRPISCLPCLVQTFLPFQFGPKQNSRSSWCLRTWLHLQRKNMFLVIHTFGPITRSWVRLFIHISPFKWEKLPSEMNTEVRCMLINVKYRKTEPAWVQQGAIINFALSIFLLVQ